MKSLFKLPFLIIALTAISFQACLDEAEEPNQQLSKDIETIDAYLANQGIEAEEDVLGLRMDIHTLGTGLVPNFKSSVTVDYVGRVLGSTDIFDDGTINGAISGYIAGWQIALTTMPIGTSATLYIPSPLAYGATPKPGIPANSILVFEVTLKDMYVSNAEKSQFTADTTAINNYIDEKQIENYVKDPTGIRYVKTHEVESGPTPGVYDKVKFKLILKLLSDDATELANVTREPDQNFNGRVIDNVRALVTLLPKMKEGEKATVYIPSYLGFHTEVVTGSNGATLVPANTPVIMEIELLDVL